VHSLIIVVSLSIAVNYYKGRQDGGLFARSFR